MLFIIKLNSLSTASSYQEWFQIKARASKWDQAFIFYNIQTPRLIIETGVYSEEALIMKYSMYVFVSFYTYVQFVPLNNDVYRVVHSCYIHTLITIGQHFHGSVKVFQHTILLLELLDPCKTLRDRPDWISWKIFHEILYSREVTLNPWNFNSSKNVTLKYIDISVYNVCSQWVLLFLIETWLIMGFQHFQMSKVHQAWKICELYN